MGEDDYGWDTPNTVESHQDRPHEPIDVMGENWDIIEPPVLTMHRAVTESNFSIDSRVVFILE